MVFYSVWRTKDDQPVCIHVNAIQAAAAMGIESLNTFYSAVSRSISGINKKWAVIKENEDKESEDDF